MNNLKSNRTRITLNPRKATHNPNKQGCYRRHSYEANTNLHWASREPRIPGSRETLGSETAALTRLSSFLRCCLRNASVGFITLPPLVVFILPFSSLSGGRQQWRRPGPHQRGGTPQLPAKGLGSRWWSDPWAHVTSRPSHRVELIKSSNSTGLRTGPDSGQNRPAQHTQVDWAESPHNWARDGHFLN